MKRKLAATRFGSIRTPSEIEALLEQHQSLREVGYTNSEIAERLQVPHSTLYRWSRERDKSKVTEGIRARVADFNIDRAIAILSVGKKDPAEFISAIAFFIAWLRWPSSPELHETGALTVSLRYVREKSSATYLYELPDIYKAIFQRFVRIDDMIKVMSLDGPQIPYLDEFDIQGKRYTDRDVIADVANYILAASFEESRKSTRPSLNKAYHLIEKGAFNHAWPFSKSKFQTVWRCYAPASPFLFVENFGPSLEWLVDPTSTDFAEAFAELENNPEEIRLFLSKAKWALGEIKRRLDHRAVANIAFPNFPTDLPKVPVKPHRLNRNMVFELKAYSSKNQ